MLPYYSLNRSGNTVTFYLPIYSPVFTVGLYQSTQVAQLNPGCSPTTSRVVYLNTSGRNVELFIYPNGTVWANITSGSPWTAGTTLYLSGSYNIN